MTLEQSWVMWTFGFLAGTFTNILGNNWQSFVLGLVIGGASYFIAVKLTGAK